MDDSDSSFIYGCHLLESTSFKRPGFALTAQTSCGAAFIVKPNARLLRALGYARKYVQSCGAAIDRIGLRGTNYARVLSPLRGSKITVTVYPRLADSPWA